MQAHIVKDISVAAEGHAVGIKSVDVLNHGPGATTVAVIVTTHPSKRSGLEALAVVLKTHPAVHISFIPYFAA